MLDDNAMGADSTAEPGSRPTRAVIYVPRTTRRSVQDEWEKDCRRKCEDKGWAVQAITRNPAQAWAMKLAGQVDRIVYPPSRASDLLLDAEPAHRRGGRWTGVAIPVAVLDWVREHARFAGAAVAATAAGLTAVAAVSTFTLDPDAIRSEGQAQPAPSPPAVTVPVQPPESTESPGLGAPSPPTVTPGAEPTPQPTTDAGLPEVVLPATPDPGLPELPDDTGPPSVADLPGDPGLPDALEVPRLPVDQPPLPVDPPPGPPGEPELGEPLACADLVLLQLDPSEVCIP